MILEGSRDRRSSSAHAAQEFRRHGMGGSGAIRAQSKPRRISRERSSVTHRVPRALHTIGSGRLRSASALPTRSSRPRAVAAEARRKSGAPASVLDRAPSRRDRSPPRGRTSTVSLQEFAGHSMSGRSRDPFRTMTLGDSALDSSCASGRAPSGPTRQGELLRHCARSASLSRGEKLGAGRRDLGQRILDIAQRIVRAKNKIREARIPYEVPGRAALPGSTACCARSTSSSTKGYLASSGDTLTRHDLSGEAIRLGRLLVELLPEPEAVGLLALMLLQEFAPRGAHLAQGRARAARRPGPFAVEPRADRGRHGPRRGCARIAAFRAVHAAGGDRGGARGAPAAEATDWGRSSALRRAPARRAVLPHRAEPRGGGRDARRSRRGLGPHRRDPRARRPGRLTLAHSPGRTSAAASVNRRSACFLQTGPRPHPAASERRFLEQRLAELEK